MRCPHCPVNAKKSCLGETHAPACLDVASGLPGRADQLIAIAEGRPPEPPSPLAMLGSFARAMRGLIADGGRLAPRSVRKARRSLCEACLHHTASPDACSKCGCGQVVPGGLAAKLAIASSFCPDDPPRWTAV